MLALKIVREGYAYKEEVNGMDDEIIAQSEAVFADKVVRGVIKAPSYNSLQWSMSDEVQQNVTLNFRLDEVHFARKASKQLNCTLAHYQQAMRVAATSCLGFSLNYIQCAVAAMRNYANHLEFPTTYEAGQIIADLLCILPGDSTFRIQTIDKIHDIDNPKNGTNQQRQLAHYQSYMEFDRYLEKFWAEATVLEQIIFFLSTSGIKSRVLFLFGQRNAFLRLEIVSAVMRPAPIYRSVEQNSKVPNKAAITTSMTIMKR